MKTPAFLSMPWDMVVFLTITTVGFGFSVQKLTSAEVSQDRSVAMAMAADGFTAPSSLSGHGQTLDLGCVERKIGRDRANSVEGAIRIRGKFCHLTRKAMKGFDGVRVRNLTNGYEGTIFFHGADSGFTTDFVVLQSGKNLIQVEWKDSPTASLREYQAEVYEK